MKRVAAIIVTYNRREKLQRCLEAVLAQNTGKKPGVFIVDNGSRDGTEEMVEDIINNVLPASDCENVIYHNLHFNSGCAGAFNYGIRRALNAGYDYFWLMDDDAVPSSDALNKLIEFNDIHLGEYGFLSSKVLYTDGSLCRMNIPRETAFTNVKDWNRSVIPISMASFLSLFLPAEVVMDVGLPIREFFIWTDDWEYTRRISLRYPCYLITDSIAVHDCESPGGADIAAADSARLDRFRYLYRNDVYLYRREGFKGFCYELARLSFHGLKIAVSKKIIGEKLKRLGIMLKGTAEGLRFFPLPEFPDLADSIGDKK